MKVVLCGGGTGGHVIPMLAIWQELKILRPELKAIYIGARGAIEEGLAKGEGLPFKGVWIAQFRRKNLTGNILLPLKMIVALGQAIRILKQETVKFVVGTGGYSSWPAFMAASLLRVPYFIHESNAYPGLVTRLLGKKSTRVFVGFEAASKVLDLKNDQCIVSGNPSLLCFAGDIESARREFNILTENKTLLVTGGSGGARTINNVIKDSLGQLFEQGWNVIWQTGKSWTELNEVPEKWRGRLYIKNLLDPRKMALAYQLATVAVARCGAMTLTDLAIAGVPSILIPYPYSADGHQDANARSVEQAGGAIMIKDSEFNPERLFNALNITCEPVTRDRMKQSMLSLANPDAAKSVAQNILKTMGVI